MTFPRNFFWTVVTSLLLLVNGPATASEKSPYAGEETRTIKSLSQDQVQGLLAGDGLGYAKAAELNGWPGPRHVLDLKDELQLTIQQNAAIETVFDRMNADARSLGNMLVEAEKALDRLFAGAMPEAGDVAESTNKIAGIEGALRAVHLNAHLETSAVLTRHQRMMYARARGYSTGHGHGDKTHGE